jgi:hypothetical protein
VGLDFGGVLVTKLRLVLEGAENDLVQPRVNPHFPRRRGEFA